MWQAEAVQLPEGGEAVNRVALTRRTPLRRLTRLRPTRRKENRQAAGDWYVAVLQHGGEPLRSVKDGNGRILFEAHHPISRQACRKYGAPEWDPRNGMLVTVIRHARHHSRLEPIRRDELPASVFVFAREFGLEAWLDRFYPEATA